MRDTNCIKTAQLFLILFWATPVERSLINPTSKLLTSCSVLRNSLSVQEPLSCTVSIFRSATSVHWEWKSCTFIFGLFPSVPSATHFIALDNEVRENALLDRRYAVNCLFTRALFPSIVATVLHLKVFVEIILHFRSRGSNKCIVAPAAYGIENLRLCQAFRYR